VPIYEYKCDGCDKRVEVLQKHTDPAPSCDACTEQMDRQVSRCSFKLDGAGWARDNYGLTTEAKP